VCPHERRRDGEPKTGASGTPAPDDRGNTYPFIGHLQHDRVLARVDAVLTRTPWSRSGDASSAFWEGASFETTLLRELSDLVSVRYVTFAGPMELRVPLVSSSTPGPSSSRAG